MKRMIQNHESVVHVVNGNQAVVVRVADRAHRSAPTDRPYLGKRLSDPKLGRRKRLGATGGGSSLRELSGWCETSTGSTSCCRAAGEPPAMAWGMLVVSRAMSS